MLMFNKLVLLLFPLLLMAQADMKRDTLEKTSFKEAAVISNINNQKKYTINQNDKIKLWSVNGKVKGKLYGTTNTSILVISERDTLAVLKNDILRIKLFHGTLGKVSGVTTMLLGGAGMVYGTLGLVVGIQGFINDDLSAVVIVLSPLLPIGYGVYRLGARFYGKTLKLSKGWIFLE